MFKQDYLYWKMIEKLQLEGGYRILQLSKSNNEIWLETTQKNKPRIIRILRHDLDWSNWMQRDMEITAGRLEQLRKRLYVRKLDALNIYITTFPPVDDWKFRLQDPLVAGAKGHTTLHTVLIDSEHLDTGLQEVSKFVQTDFKLDDSIYIDVETIESIKREVITVANKRISNEKQVFQNGKPFFTYILIAIQIIMFAILELHGGSTNTETLLKYGAKENFRILNGEWWRFFSPMILHIGFIHLLMNTLALYYLGAEVERLYGKLRFLMIYVFAGFVGSLASFVFNANISAGASGAIFGCFGALLFFGTAYPSLFFRTMGPNVIGIIIINLALGFMIPGIDNSGHIGGLVGGFLAASIVHLPKQKEFAKRLGGLAATIVTVCALLYVGYVVQPHSDNPQFIVQTAQEYIEANEIQKAYDVLLTAEKQGTDSPEVFFYLSYTEIKLGKLEEARDHLEIVTNKAPKISEAHYNLALVYVQLQDYEHAKKAVEQAIKVDPENENYKELMNEINAMENGSL
ncbi:rhomboid family intramembrane serine protease [Bacillus sp. REN16]|uniref:rhomboid family intramembrane serine protease n=1 Tax=Bacillus sp. REN16 TaxID=2887296 RepID=UPI001E296303|nr:rhomboid family intramembrane serine protease [Bacillus sp. REN16]MCC3356725.1 rhomboid family intramembrane serine protease [Bacillus sp. REN16]